MDVVDEDGGPRPMEATLTAGPTTSSPATTGIPQQRPLQRPPAPDAIQGPANAAGADEAARCVAEDAAVEAARRAFELELELASTPTGSSTRPSSVYS